MGEPCERVEGAAIFVGAGADRVEMQADRVLLHPVERRRELRAVAGGELGLDAEDAPVASGSR